MAGYLPWCFSVWEALFEELTFHLQTNIFISSGTGTKLHCSEEMSLATLSINTVGLRQRPARVRLAALRKHLIGSGLLFYRGPPQATRWPHPARHQQGRQPGQSQTPEGWLFFTYLCFSSSLRLYHDLASYLIQISKSNYYIPVPFQNDLYEIFCYIVYNFLLLLRPLCVLFLLEKVAETQ